MPPDPPAPIIPIPLGRTLLCAGCDRLVVAVAGGLRYDVPGGARHRCRRPVPDHTPPPQD